MRRTALSLYTAIQITAPANQSNNNYSTHTGVHLSTNRKQSLRSRKRRSTANFHTPVVATQRDAVLDVNLAVVSGGAMVLLW